MRNQAESQQLLLGLGAAGALAVVAASTLAYAILQRRRRQPYSKVEWEQELQPTGEIRDFDSIVDQIAVHALEPCIRPDVWPFLLEVFDSKSSFQQRQSQHQLMVRQYQQLLLQCQAYEAALKDSFRPGSPTAAAAGSAGHAFQQQTQLKLPQQQQLSEQVRQFAEAHRIIVIDAVRTDFQRHSAVLASVYEQSGCSCNSTTSSFNSSNAYSISAAANAGVAAVASFVSNGLNSIQQFWLHSLLGGQAAVWGHHQALWVSEAAHLVLQNSTHMADESKRQACRMIAMLSAYALHDPATGYCQGMSDLLLPFVLLIEDDALAFWCFVALMQRQGLRRNFAADEGGIFEQLRCLWQVLEVNDKPLIFRLHQLGAAECHFAYRMVLVMMRRELSVEKVMEVWEVLWADAWRQRKQPVAVDHEDACSVEAQQLSLETVQKATPAIVNGAADGSVDEKQLLFVQHRDELQHAGSRTDLFIYFVAAVVISQRRAVLDQCCDSDDVLRLFHSIKHIDVWHCLEKAQELRAVVLQQQGQHKALQTGNSMP